MLNLFKKIKEKRDNDVRVRVKKNREDIDKMKDELKNVRKKVVEVSAETGNLRTLAESALERLANATDDRHGSEEEVA